jgi:Na+-translocating ferredoxin:NAD+ oxidoreductase RnfG subunit
MGVGHRETPGIGALKAKLRWKSNRYAQRQPGSSSFLQKRTKKIMLSLTALKKKGGRILASSPGVRTSST